MELELIPWTAEAPPPSKNAVRLQLEQNGYNVFLWNDAPGTTYSPHSHDCDECIWGIAGEITFIIGGRRYRLGPGDRLMLPRGTVHAADVGPQGASYAVGERNLA